MDASQITKLLQIQNTRYINRSQTVDSSTLTWKNQIQSSKYIKGVKTCDGQQNTNVPTNPCCADQVAINGVLTNTGTYSFGGSGRTTAIQNGSPQQFLNVLSGAAGSASQVYSSESVTLQRAGKESCGVPGVSPAPENSYVILPACYCVDTNGPTATTPSQLSNPVVTGISTITGNPNDLPVNNQSNPYLPPFDTYYRFKNPQCPTGRTGPNQVSATMPDQNLQHFVKVCHTRFPNANNGENAVFDPSNNVTTLDPVTKQFVTTTQYINDVQVLQPTMDGCVLSVKPFEK